jgi:hypothetical protein
MLKSAEDASPARCSKRSPGAWQAKGGWMTHEQRTARIKTLKRELSTLLEEESPRPAVKFLSAQDIPAWVAEGLREAIRRKCAEESQAAH